MNSRWQVNKIGLIDFWYYDEEEFHFSEGRMLLRGSNGSGKSVTMQSFIPLLLDGNMRPERLDPFGSRARKMENYLLEENDDREERTGYLYMEYKRMDSNTYLTTGIGIRARRAKKLDTWYFIIQDGRRIKEDLYLYKDTHGKIPLSKLELKNRIGEGGKLIESQSEYMAFVNKLIFGFDTIDEYKEMIELLIQLRTPKLSKEFRPTLINEILSSSLQPLSEDDLRPMSEAIENMDNLKTNLDALKQARDAAKKIARIYDRYNQFMLFDKARQYKECHDAVRNIEKDIKTYQEAITKNEKRQKEAEERLRQLETEEKVLKEEENSLNKSDAKILKEKELNYIKEEKAKTEELNSKNRSLDDKKEKQKEADNKKKLIEGSNESIKDDIESCLNEMKDVLVNISFDEHDLMAGELLKEINESYNFDMHEEMLEELLNKVEEGISFLNEEEGLKKNYDILLRALEQLRAERDAAEREAVQLDNQFIEVKGELLEKLYAWNDKNEVLIAEKENLREAATLIENYSDKSDYSDIKEKLRLDKENVQKSIFHDILDLRTKMNEKNEEINEVKEILIKWQNTKDPEPERPESVRKSRDTLRERGIEFVEFYKVVDFDEGMPKRERDCLEEALHSMGILDALIVSSEDREAILKLDEGLCDKYIFDDISSVKNNMNDLMNIVNPDKGLEDIDNIQDVNIFIYQKISNILSGISCQGSWNQDIINDGMPNGHTSFHSDGSYQLGILTGTITREYQSRFIGVKRREEYRQSIIKEHEDKLKLLEDEYQVIIGNLARVEAKNEILEQEWSDFPKGDDIKTALKLCQESEALTERLTKECRQKEEGIKTEQVKLDKVREQVLNIAGKLCLKARLDLFKDARKELSDYQKLLNQLQIHHTKYLSGQMQLRQYEDQLEGLLQDIDNLLYDIVRIKRELKDISQNLASIREQLKLTDYEQIKERLNDCIERLLSIPDEKRGLYQQGQSAIEHIKFNEEAKNDKETALETYRKKHKITEELFLKEYQLGYVTLIFQSLSTTDVESGKDGHENKNNDSLCLKIYQSFDETFKNKKREDYNKDVQEIFHANKGMLSEYYLMQEYIFAEYDEDNIYEELYFKRIDITAKYRGTPVKFHELLVKIENDIEEQNNLLNQRDRELFEDILADTISKKIRAKIYNSVAWVENMNKLMISMITSSGLTLSLRWKSKKAEHEDQLDTRNLVELLKKDAEIMKEEDFLKLSAHFRSKISEARKVMEEEETIKSFHSVMREILDYRNWFEFQLEFQKIGETKKELTDRAFYIFSGGEKAMAMYVPLFSAVTAKYQGARLDAPKLISLDEAFAGVDETNIRDMYRLMVEFDFSFIINSQILWGDADTLPSIAIYQLIRPENVKFVTVIPYLWNGKTRVCLEELAGVNIETG